MRAPTRHGIAPSLSPVMRTPPGVGGIKGGAYVLNVMDSYGSVFTVILRLHCTLRTEG